jgi:hypothetical protein
MNPLIVAVFTGSLSGKAGSENIADKTIRRRYFLFVIQFLFINPVAFF